MKPKTLRTAALSAAAAMSLAGCSWLAEAGGGGPHQNDMTIGEAERRQVIDAVISELQQHYVYPDKAAAVARELRAMEQKGDFAAVTSAEKLADVLTDDLRSQTADHHLMVRYFEQAVPEPSSTGDDPAQEAAERREALRFNFGIDSVRRLHGNIGYIDVHSFDRPDQVKDRIASALSLLRDTGALIIDLRKDGGGDPDTVMLFASYFFDQPAHLNDIYWRDGDHIQQRWTQGKVDGNRYGQSRKIYVLTSHDTFSGGEDFAYAMKYAGRATVVGETTGGGAHPGDPHRLDAHFMMFVPNGRVINPVTHTDWEGVGVEPDVKTSADKALDVAQALALKSMIASESDPDWKSRLQSALADVE